MAIKSRDVDMCSGPLAKNLLVFALPIMVMNILQLLFNAADTVVVGRFDGKEAMAAVGATGALVNLLVNLFMGLSVGTSVVVATDFGAHSPDGVFRSVHTSILLGILGGVGVMLIGLVASGPLLRLMDTPEDIIGRASVYLRIYFLGMPANMVYNFGAAVLRAVGDSRRPMVFLLVSGLVNVVLNVIFVAGFHQGVAGVAWATVISQTIAAALMLAFLMRSSGALHFDIRHLHIDRQKLRAIVRIGVPAGLQGMLFSVSNVLIQSAVNSFGSTLVAAATASGNIQNFFDTTSNAYYNAAISFTGQNMGAKKYDRVDGIAKCCAAFTFITWFVVGGLMLLLGAPLMRIYTSDAEVIALGMTRLRVMTVLYFACGIMNVFPGITRGMGYSVAPMLCTLVGVCLMRMVWLATVFQWHHTVLVLYACYPVTWALTGIGQVGIFFYARAKLRRGLAPGQRA